MPICRTYIIPSLLLQSTIAMATAEHLLLDKTWFDDGRRLVGYKSMAMTKRYDHANEERYGAAIEALDAAGKTSSAEALAAARWKQTE